LLIKIIKLLFYHLEIGMIINHHLNVSDMLENYIGAYKEVFLTADNNRTGFKTGLFLYTLRQEYLTGNERAFESS
jgi:hypothetical protein